MAKLVFVQGPMAGQEHTIEGRTTIGRQSGNSIQIVDGGVSRDHASVEFADNTYRLKDLGSRNGTFVNGAPVTEKLLADGDEIKIGGAFLVFKETPRDQKIGERLGGYRILEKLGEGGVGIVYKARQISMDRLVALKILNENLTKNAEYVKRFVFEARTAGKLNNPNIIQVHDFGEEKGIYFFSMEFVDGETIQQVLDREGRIPLDRCLFMVREVARALEYAQKNHVIHQDIKPQNVMVDRENRVKLADLGLAKVIGADDADRKRNLIIGTPLYMSPEQATRDPVDERTDIYSLGATFYHMVTGRPPFQGETALAVIAKHIHEPPPSPRKYNATLPEAVCNFILKMMAKSPADRFNSAAALGAALDSLQLPKKTKPAPVVTDTAMVKLADKGKAYRQQHIQKFAFKNQVSTMIWGLILAILFFFLAMKAVRILFSGG